MLRLASGSTLRPLASTLMRKSGASSTATTLKKATAVRAMGTVTYSPPAWKIGKPAPKFTAGAVVDGEMAKVSLDDYKGKYTVLLFYPKDFTDIIAFSDAVKQFDEVNAKVIAISTDTEESHLAWIRKSRKTGGLGHMQMPLVADVTKTISADYGVLIEEIGIALRGLFIIDGNGILQQATINNLPVGRSVAEAIRLIQAFQFVEKHGEVCPAGWKPGDKSMKADPEGSLEYFGSTKDSEEDALIAGPKVVSVRDSKQFMELIKKHPKVVVDFVAPWCGKCKQIMPFVNQLSEDFPDVTFLKVDTTEDAVGDLVAELHVSVLPAFHFYANGQPTGKEPILGYKKTPLKEAVAALAKK